MVGLSLNQEKYYGVRTQPPRTTRNNTIIIIILVAIIDEQLQRPLNALSAAAQGIYDGPHILEAEVNTLHHRLSGVAGQKQRPGVHPRREEVEHDLRLRIVLNLVHIHLIVVASTVAAAGAQRFQIAADQEVHHSVCVVPQAFAFPLHYASILLVHSVRLLSLSALQSTTLQTELLKQMQDTGHMLKSFSPKINAQP